MSDLKQTKTTVVIGEASYSLAFNLNVLDAVLDRYGSLAALVAELTPGETGLMAKMDVFLWLLLQMVNDDIDARIEAGEALKPLSLKGLKRQIDMTNLPAIKDAVYGAVLNGMPRVQAGDEEEEKN